MTSRQARLWTKKLAKDERNKLTLMGTDAKGDDYNFRGNKWVSISRNCERIIFTSDCYGNRLLGTLKIKEIDTIEQLKDALANIDLSKDVEY